MSRLNARPEPWHRQGVDPDYRFSLANERTYLAWIRTALALLAGAIVLDQVGLRFVPGWVAPLLATALSLFTAGLGVVAYLRWRDNEIAMRHGRPLPRPAWLPALSLLLAGLGIGAALVAAIG